MTYERSIDERVTINTKKIRFSSNCRLTTEILLCFIDATICRIPDIVCKVLTVISILLQCSALLFWPLIPDSIGKELKLAVILFHLLLNIGEDE